MKKRLTEVSTHVFKHRALPVKTQEVKVAKSVISSNITMVFCVFLGADDEFGGLLSSNLILLRNRLLDILLKLLFTCKEKNTVNAQ